MNRFRQLIEQESSIMKTRQRYVGRSEGGLIREDQDYVDFELVTQWANNGIYLIEKVFKGDSDLYYEEFGQHFPNFTSYSNCTHAFRMALSVLKAAKDDFENNFLRNSRVLIEAEVFEDFLEQAEHLLKQGYFGPAAVITGCVLEDGLRKLCLRNSITLPAKPKLDQMNIDLAKVPVYSKLVQKQITALADIRNNAAHGDWTKFTDKDVEQMILQVRSFMATHFT